MVSNETLFIKNVIRAYSLIREDALALIKPKSSVLENSTINPSHLIRLDLFLTLLSKTKAIQTLHLKFSSITDWDFFYKSYNNFEEDTLERFIYLIHSLKEIKKFDNSLHPKIVATFENPSKANPYITGKVSAPPEIKRELLTLGTNAIQHNQSVRVMSPLERSALLKSNDDWFKKKGKKS